MNISKEEHPSQFAIGTKSTLAIAPCVFLTRKHPKSLKTHIVHDPNGKFFYLNLKHHESSQILQNMWKTSEDLIWSGLTTIYMTGFSQYFHVA